MNAPSTEPTRLVCPKCGSGNITSWETAPMAYHGARFYANPDGDLNSMIVDYDDADREAGDGEYDNDLECRRCLTRLTEADLVPEGTPVNPRFPTVPVAINEEQAVDLIHKLLDGREWRVDDLDGIADIIRLTGREIREPVEDQQ